MKISTFDFSKRAGTFVLLALLNLENEIFYRRSNHQLGERCLNLSSPYTKGLLMDEYPVKILLFGQIPILLRSFQEGLNVKWLFLFLTLSILSKLTREA